MSCEHYWREGILLVERGEPDPHRDTCLQCRRAHEARGHLVGALPMVGGTRNGDPSWQTRVWGRIARDEASRARRSYWIAGGFAAAAAVVLLCVHFGAGSADHGIAERPRFDIVPGPVAMRSTSARVGDRVRISVGRGQEARVYRANHLVLRCPVGSTAPGCTPDDQGLVAEALLGTAGEYQLVMILAATADPVGTLDRDLAAVVSAGGEYKVTDLSVR
jgi:hypothetical protein